MFIALKKEYFEAFAQREKREEFRLYGARWNERVCTPGRAVTLSCGYSGPRLNGVIAGFRTIPAREVPGIRAVYPDVKPRDMVAAIAIDLT
jgi:hypothetical protein